MKISRAEFLRSDISGSNVLVTRSEEQYFGRFMVKYNSGKLQPRDVKRNNEKNTKSLKIDWRSILNYKQIYIRGTNEVHHGILSFFKSGHRD